MKRAPGLALTLLAGCASPEGRVAPLPPVAPASATTASIDVGPVEVRWAIEVLPGWQMTERVCWSGAPMQVVMPEAKAGLNYVVAAHDGDGRVLDVGARGVSVTGTSCASLTLDLARAAAELADNDALTMVGQTLFGSPDVWLWRPEPWPPGTVGTLSLALPPGMNASVPWPPAPTSGSYLVDATTWQLMSKAAIGDVVVRTIEVGDATFTLARLPGELGASSLGLERWLRDAAGAVSLVGAVDGRPRFPVRHAQVLLVPVFGGDAIPFGMAMRGGGPTAMMLVSRTADDGELRGEWVGVHELSHLLLPPLHPEDAWLAEGMASYYQQTLRGRAGLLSVAQSWGLLIDGYDRGRKASRGTSLRSASARMRSDFGYLQVYWGGAAIALRLDVALRQGGTSLDAVVAGVRAREPRDVHYRSADEIVAWMGEQAPGVDVKGIVDAGLAERFPPVDDLLEQLGLRRGRDRRAVLVKDAALVDVRDAIIGAGRR